MAFEDSFKRVKSATDLKNQTQLADFLGIKQPQISKSKKRDNFPLEWAFKIASKYNLSTDWILSGSGKEKQSKDNFFLQLESWGKESSGSDDIQWLKNQIENAFPMFKEWKKRKEEQQSESDNSGGQKIA